MSEETIHARPDISYGAYLALDELLGAQRPRSPEHDELLFIVIHQASELWMKLSIHELAAARRHIADDDLGPAFKMIARVSRIQAQMIQSWDVLATLTPSEYSAIRPHLGQSSGFQSHQYRLLEFLMGAKDASMLRVHEETPYHAILLESLASSSLYDECVRLLARRGFAIPPELVDLEFRFQQWRFAHMKTVERIIGFKGGTGGSSGASYLARALTGSFFPELFKVRTNL